MKKYQKTKTKRKNNQKGVAEPGMRPPGAASPSAKSIQEDEIPLTVMAGRMKKFSEHTSTIPEVMDSNTLNFNPNFKFSLFWGGGASTFG